MLPLDDKHLVKTIKYLQTEILPIIPELKNSIVDVLCTDIEGRTFVVEMQMYWTTYFKQRILFNASKMYVTQIERGEDYSALQPVYALNLVNDIFDEDSQEYYHHYKMCEQAHPEKTIDGIELFFVELPKFTPKTFTDKKMRYLWLKFLTTIGEKTIEPDNDLVENPLIFKALDMCKHLTADELAGYDLYWDAVSTAKTLASGKFNDGLQQGLKQGMEEGIKQGREEGIKQGIEQGQKEERIKMAIAMLKSGIDKQTVAQITQLSLSEIEKIS